jgi:hypothetical protein
MPILLGGPSVARAPLVFPMQRIRSWDPWDSPSPPHTWSSNAWRGVGYLGSAAHPGSGLKPTPVGSFSSDDPAWLAVPSLPSCQDRLRDSPVVLGAKMIATSSPMAVIVHAPFQSASLGQRFSRNRLSGRLRTGSTPPRCWYPLSLTQADSSIPPQELCFIEVQLTERIVRIARRNGQRQGRRAGRSTPRPCRP